MLVGLRLPDSLPVPPHNRWDAEVASILATERSPEPSYALSEL